MNTLVSKVAIVTGASKGIGKATALALAKAGAAVVVNYSSDDAPAKDVVKTIGSKRAVAVKADVSTIAGIESLIQKTVDLFGRIDILIANAGVLPMKDLEHTTEKDFDHTFALNVKGPYFLCQV
jgi:3-oxoacyl-[acyl-carrier protein] reductase